MHHDTIQINKNKATLLILYGNNKKKLYWTSSAQTTFTRVIILEGAGSRSWWEWGTEWGIVINDEFNLQNCTPLKKEMVLALAAHILKRDNVLTCYLLFFF